MKNLIFSVCILLFSFSLQAAEDTPDGPDVEIKSGKKDITFHGKPLDLFKVEIEEYRQHGQRYMIKVTPKKGKPYYLVDADGDGDLDTRRAELDPNLLIPSWVLFSW